MDPSHWSIQFEYEKNENHINDLDDLRGHYILGIPFKAEWGKHIQHENRLEPQFGVTLFDQAIEEKENACGLWGISYHKSVEGFDYCPSRYESFDGNGDWKNPFHLVKPPTIVIDFERAFKSYNDKLEKRELEEWVEKETEETDHRNEGCPHM